MKRPTGALWSAIAGAILASWAWATPPASNPIATAVRRGDCDAAIELVKAGAAADDRQALFLGGRMLDEGICVVQNPDSAAQYFERAASLGDKDASLEYAAKVGLGEGAAQDYAKAGELCRAAGLDPQARLSGYSLGYACTLRSVAATHVRVTLPAGAFKPGTGPTRVEFIPARSAMRVLATPKVARGSQPALGKQVADPLVDADRVIEDAWKAAVARAPKPDPGHLDAQSIELSLDTDTPLENGPPSEDPKLREHRGELPFAAKLGSVKMGSGH
jgi:hypothetical protein